MIVFFLVSLSLKSILLLQIGKSTTTHMMFEGLIV